MNIYLVTMKMMLILWVIVGLLITLIEGPIVGKLLPLFVGQTVSMKDITESLVACDRRDLTVWSLLQISFTAWCGIAF
jgi:putative exporter of polyketide antibiotics